MSIVWSHLHRTHALTPPQPHHVTDRERHVQGLLVSPVSSY